MEETVVQDKSEFKAWREIEKFTGIHVIVTEKIHGANCHVNVVSQPDGSLKAIAGKRTSYVGTQGLFGFGEFVTSNEKEICEKLGPGRHYAEWTGAGVNGDYGLKNKTAVLFNTRHHGPKKAAGVLPDRFDVVPVLYDGPYVQEKIDEVLADLKANGSKFSHGYMRPEGVVLFFPLFNAYKKIVFKPEETGWTKSEKMAKDPNAPKVDYSGLAAPYLQEVRLEKLLMRDDKYTSDFPNSLPLIMKDYLADLLKDTQGLDDATIHAIKKCAFTWAKERTESMLHRFVNVT